MRKKVMKIGGIVLFLIGCVFILNSFSGMTGFAVAESIGKSASGIIGFVFVVGGVLVFVAGRSLDDYFNKRVSELTQNSDDVWIAQWEINKLKDEFKNRGYKTIRGPEGEEGGYKKGPNIRHLKLKGYNESKIYINKHLFITQDPEDDRIRKTNDGFKSKIYPARGYASIRWRKKNYEN